MSSIALRIIGVVNNGRASTADAGWGALESEIVLAPEFAPGLTGLSAFSHALVIFFMEHDPDGEAPAVMRRPRGRADMPHVGVFAQRGRMRPNPLGVTAVEVVSVAEDRLRVRGLDAIHGTPVLDLKPYVPDFDRVCSPRVPEWMDTLMKGYFS